MHVKMPPFIFVSIRWTLMYSSQIRKGQAKQFIVFASQDLRYSSKSRIFMFVH